MLDFYFNDILIKTQIQFAESFGKILTGTSFFKVIDKSIYIIRVRVHI